MSERRPPIYGYTRVSDSWHIVRTSLGVFFGETRDIAHGRAQQAADAERANNPNSPPSSTRGLTVCRAHNLQG